MNYIDYLGYAASTAIVISFILKNVNSIRIINSIGCLLFVTYGILLPSIPVIIANGAVIIINMYHLFQHHKS
ncbi:YgjV family protein [Microbacter margulisiae]|uniref:Uncharacterized protein with PQ loop repeat n=1 Tax=Microbacter margulisiae TaxID=1350067 RepID=A0A7W5H1V7_9PORP|nr:YgjV family protein [Microbacter margulisiae]MBB3188028.1 uncharacterized protein with PQ loop repeat [Microbacter margulisiae]